MNRLLFSLLSSILLSSSLPSPLLSVSVSVLSILTVSGPGEFSCVESTHVVSSTPGGAIPSMPSSFSLATICLPEPKPFDISQSAAGDIELTTPIFCRHGFW